MSGTAVKRKRFEGLIQFQDPLRQALVCIQASGGTRFATAFQSDFLKARNTEDLSHFLMTSDGSELSDMSGGVEEQHLLMSVEQLEDGQTLWKQQTPVSDVKISAWINSGDPLACQQIYTLLAAATSKGRTFDLNKLSVSGSLKCSLAKGVDKVWMKGERQSLFNRFLADAQNILNVDESTLISDGCSVSLLLEGFTNLSANEAFAAALQHLKNSSRHFVVLNYISGARPRIQCALLTPMRLPLKELQSAGMKGFVFLRDVKRIAELKKSELAS